MKNLASWLLVLLLAAGSSAWAAAVGATAPATPADEAAKRWARFEPEFRAFAAAD